MQIRGMPEPGGVFSWPGLGGAMIGHSLALLGLACLLWSSIGAGRPIVRLCKVASGGIERAALSAACGWGFIALIQHGLGLTGLYFPAVLRIEAGALLLSGLACFMRDAAGGKIPGVGARNRMPAIATGILLAGAFALARLPDVHEDARQGHFAAPEQYLLLHKITAEPQHMAWHMARGAEMVCLIPWHLAGIDGGKLANIAWLMTIVAALVQAGRAIGAGGWWGAVLACSCGMAISEVWEGKNDLGQAAGLAGALWCALRAMTGGKASAPVPAKPATGRWWLPAGWLLGAAMGVKYTAGFYLAGGIAGVAWGKRSRVELGKAALVGVLFAVPFIGWVGESWLFLGNPVYPFLSGVFPTLGWGPYYERAMHELIARLSPAESGKWRDVLGGAWRVLGDPAMGSPALFALLPLAALIASGKRSLPTAKAVNGFGAAVNGFGAGSGFLLVVFGVAWGLWGLTERTARYMYMAGVCAAVLGGAVLEADGGKHRQQSWRRLPNANAGRGTAGVVDLVGTGWRREAMRWTVAGMALWYAGAAWMVQGGTGKIGLLLGQEKRESYMEERFTTWWSAIGWLNGHVPPAGRVLFSGEDRRLWVNMRVRSGSVVTTPLFWRLTRESRDAAEVRRRVKQLGLTHQLYNFLSGEFRRHVWFQGPDWDERQLRLYHEYLRRYHRVVYVAPVVDNDNGGFYIYEIEPRPRANPPAWVDFLPDAEGIFKEAKYAGDLGRYPEAVAAYGRLLGIIPPVGSIHGYMGFMYRNAGDWKAAFREVRPYVEAGMVDGVGLPVYGEAALNLGLLTEAEWSLRKCLDVYPSRADANRVNLSLVYVCRAGADAREGRPDSALRKLAGAEWMLALVSVARDPRVADPLRQTRAMMLGIRADVAMAKGERRKAARLYTEAVRMAPDVPEAVGWEKRLGRVRAPGATKR